MAKKSEIPTYEQHPVALHLMPGGMSNEEFDAFCEDVQERGIIFPVTLFEGKVLDGWHRYRAAHRTGKPFNTVEYKGSDPAGYVAACNVLRRKLSSLQRALVGARMHLEHAVTQSNVCKRLGISNTVLTMVLKAIDNRNTMIIRRIENDSDYTRGMLRDELEEMGLVHENYGKSKAPQPVTSIANSVFDMGRVATEGMDDPEDPEDPDVSAMLGTVGKRPSHTERRTRDTNPQRVQNHWKDLMHDEKVTLVQMLWAEFRPIAEELGLPGLVATMTVGKAITKAKGKKITA